MKINGWILGLGAVLAVGTLAQAQVAPRPVSNEARLVADPEVAALRKDVATLKASVADLKSQLEQLKTRYNSHQHCMGVNPMAACPKTMPPFNN